MSFPTSKFELLGMIEGVVMMLFMMPLYFHPCTTQILPTVCNNCSCVQRLHANFIALRVSPVSARPSLSALGFTTCVYIADRREGLAKYYIATTPFLCSWRILRSILCLCSISQFLLSLSLEGERAYHSLQGWRS